MVIKYLEVKCQVTSFHGSASAPVLSCPGWGSLHLASPLCALAVRVEEPHGMLLNLV